MSKTIAALYRDRNTAERALQSLRSRGVPTGRISVLSHRQISSVAHPTTSPTETKSEPGKGAVAGIEGGAVGGVAASIALAAVPGIGWILAAGPIGSMIASAAVGAGIGAVTGGIGGAFQDSGIAKHEGDIYAEALRRGGTVVLISTNDSDASTVANVLNQHNPIDIDRTAERYRGEGWSAFDVQAEPFEADRVARERKHLEQEAIGNAREARGVRSYGAKHLVEPMSLTEEERDALRTGGRSEWPNESQV